MIKPLVIELIDPDTWKLVDIDLSIKLNLSTDGTLEAYKWEDVKRTKQLIVRTKDEKSIQE
jgi:hypothetical protein